MFLDAFSCINGKAEGMEGVHSVLKVALLLFLYSWSIIDLYLTRASVNYKENTKKLNLAIHVQI